jgi:hypothetical protein
VWEGLLDANNLDASNQCNSSGDLESKVAALSGNPSLVLPKKIVTSLKKAPNAPKRFRSSYIFFSAEKHKEILAQMGDKGVEEKVIRRTISQSLLFAMFDA